MAAGATGPIIGPIIGQRTDHRSDPFDHSDRCPSRRRIRLPLVLTLFAGVLSACAWDPPTIERTPREAAGAETGAKSRLAARKGGQNGTQANGVAGEKADAPGTQTAALEVDLTNFKERLIGLDSDEINDLMGTPGLERAEPPALIWQYRHQVCTVDIFMFDDGGGSTVDHVEVRPTTAGGSVNDKDCFTALLRNVPPPSGGAARAPAGQQPISPAPSTSVNRRAVPSAAPPPGPAQTPSSSRPPTPSTAAPSAAPAAPAATAPNAGAPDGEDGLSPTDTDVDFDFGAPQGAAPGGAAAPGRPPSAAPSSEAIPTLPPELLLDEKPRSGAPPSSSSLGIEIPAAAGLDEFTDPLDSVPPAKPAAAPAPARAPVAAPAKPAPVPLAVAPPTPPTPSAPPPAAPARAATSVSIEPEPAAPLPVAPAPPAPPPSVAVAPPAPGPASLTPRATAAAQPKGAPKGAAAARPVEDIDEDLPPDVLSGRRDDDPAHNNEDLVE